MAPLAPSLGLSGGPARRRPGAGLVLRSALLGWAAGARSSLGPGAPTLTGGRGPLVRAGSAFAVVGELVADKLPSAPSRLEHGGALIRAGAGATGATMLAARDHARPLLPVLAGAVGGLAGTYGGAAWRAWADGRIPAWQAAVAEDALALTLAAIACGPGRPVRSLAG